MNQKDMAAVLESLKKYQRYLISSHVNPEGDSVGGQLAMARFLRNTGKEALIVDQDPVPDNLLFLPGSDAVSTEMQKDFQDWVYHAAVLSVRANESLKVYAGPEHPHEAQQPESLQL